jgi:hypothetical protein
MIEILNKQQVLELIDEVFEEPIKTMLLSKLEEPKKIS